jgi:hypothetical protein
VRRGITFFNFGGSCMARLLVALHSLRKHYQGEIVVFLASNDRFNERASYDIGTFAKIQWFDLEALAKRNMKCVIKPALFAMSPFDTTLMMDGDLVFQGDPSELFEPTEKEGFLLTKFSTWNTDGRKMSARIAKFKDTFSEADWLKISSGDPTVGKIAAVNIGVMGFSKQHPSYEGTLKRWKDLTMQVAGQHMADEHAAQVLYPLVPCALVGPEWNQSCVYPSDKDYTKAKVVHYHGCKESEPTRASSRIWLKAFEDLAMSRQVSGLMEYVCWQGDSLLSNLMRSEVLRDPAAPFQP